MTINKTNLAFFIDLKVSLMCSTQAGCQVGNNLEIFPDGGLWEADQCLFWGVYAIPTPQRALYQRNLLP